MIHKKTRAAALKLGPRTYLSSNSNKTPSRPQTSSPASHAPGILDETTRGTGDNSILAWLKENEDAEGFVGEADGEGFAGGVGVEGFAHEVDTKGFAGEAELKGFAGEAHMEGCVGEADTEGFMGKADAEGFAGKVDVEGFAGEADAEGFAGEAVLYGGGLVGTRGDPKPCGIGDGVGDGEGGAATESSS
ncbi:hypothetical protein DFH07DRAFT_773576 [Mycena maculata]|uniref:Uncharacterized protein n=1 Tax=Mycena maculata TaxID=230809 RepID=A0AAD7J5N8_9AGAR|nr:hypothetical protein DFH07DRAFT_773576 [Mycena maculata]